MRKIIALFAVCISTLAIGSSHREAPFITKNPKVDATDFYMFKSYEPGRSSFVTLVANYLPLQDSYGGPNYFTLDSSALYEIHIDNNGNGAEDLTFQFRFTNALADISPAIFTPTDGGAPITVGVPLVNIAGIGSEDGGFVQLGTGQNLTESYSVNVVTGNRRTGTVAAVTNTVGNSTSFRKPMDNVGTKTFPGSSYNNYARSFIHNVTIPGCAVPAKMFVGQRAEGFAVNLGNIFDLVNAPLAAITDPMLRNAFPNTLAKKNVTTIALEVDISCLKSASDNVIGAWTTASVRQARVINPTGKYADVTREGGAWAQVSRLGMPLVNEVVIGVGDKDRFNNSEPKDDVANFGKYILYPTLPFLVNALFSVPAPTVPRNDLLAVFATGVPSVNQPTTLGAVPSEMLRLNTALPATPAATQNNLGAAACFARAVPTGGRVLTLGNAGCDPAGYPNGRRPGDDIVDISLRVVEGYLMPLANAPGSDAELHDAVLQDASQFDAFFPYLKTPNPGATFP